MVIRLQEQSPLNGITVLLRDKQRTLLWRRWWPLRKHGHAGTPDTDFSSFHLLVVCYSELNEWYQWLQIRHLKEKCYYLGWNKVQEGSPEEIEHELSHEAMVRTDRQDRECMPDRTSWNCDTNTGVAERTVYPCCSTLSENAYSALSHWRIINPSSVAHEDKANKNKLRADTHADTHADTRANTHANMAEKQQKRVQTGKESQLMPCWKLSAADFCNLCELGF